MSPAANSLLSVSPRPATISPHPPALSPSPNSSLGPRFGGGQFFGGMPHRHSMSMANPGSNMYNPGGSFNPFGPSAVLGSDTIIAGNRTPSANSEPGLGPDERAEIPPLFAPRGVVAGRGGVASALSRPDFVRGFGLDITEETEEEPEEDDYVTVDKEGESEVSREIAEMEEEARALSSKPHTRHASRVSVALSLRSLGRGGKSDSGIAEEEVGRRDSIAARAWGSEGAHSPPPPREGEQEGDGINEWTGSEDLIREAISEFIDNEVSDVEKWNSTVC